MAGHLLHTAAQLTVAMIWTPVDGKRGWGHGGYPKSHLKNTWRKTFEKDLAEVDIMWDIDWEFEFYEF